MSQEKSGGSKDQFVEIVGEIGKWQILQIVVFSLFSATPTAWHILAGTFLAPNPEVKFACAPMSDLFQSEAEWTSFSSPAMKVYKFIHDD